MRKRENSDEHVRGLYLIELQQSIRDAVGKIDSVEGRQNVVTYLKKYSVFLNEVQSMAPRELLVYWEGTFAVFNYLRRCGQLQEKGKPFSPEVKSDLNRALDKALETVTI